MTHDSFSVSESGLRSFEDANQVSVSFLKSGDAGEALNKAILAKNAPLADVFFGVDNTFITRALDADIFEPYASPALAGIPPEFRLDPGNRALPVDYGDVCINYDKAYFASAGLAVPERLEDLVRPEYRGLLVTENPASSSPGLAFLLATVRHFGDPGYLDYWKDLRENGVVVVDGWETAYYTAFSGSSGQGPQPMVVSYATSPAAEVMFASSPLTDAPTGLDHWARYVLPPDRIRRHLERHAARRTCPALRGFHVECRVPGRYPRADVCLPRATRGEPAGRIHQLCTNGHAACHAPPSRDRPQ